MNRNRKKYMGFFLILMLFVQLFSSLTFVFAEDATGFIIRGVSGGAYYDPTEKVITVSEGEWFEILLEPRPHGSDLSHIKAAIENKNPSTLNASVERHLYANHQQYWYTSAMTEGQGSFEIVFKNNQDGTMIERVRVQTHSEETNTQETETVSVTGISVSPKGLEITVGQVGRICATILPSNAAEQRYSWALDKDGIIDIDTNGTVTCKAPGVVKVTAVSLEGQFQDVCTVTVHAAENTVTPSETQSTEIVPSGDGYLENPPETQEKQASPENSIPAEPVEEVRETTDNIIEKDGDEKIPETQTPASNIVPENATEIIKEIADNITGKNEDEKNSGAQDSPKIVVPEGAVEKIREVAGDIKEKAGDIKVDGIVHQLTEYESQLVEKRLEKKLTPKDAARKQVGMTIFETAQHDEEEISKINEKSYKITERLKKIAEKENIQLDEYMDANGIIRLEENDSTGLMYQLKTKQVDKLIDTVFSKTIDKLVKLLGKKNLSSGLLKSLNLFSRYAKDTKDALILTDDEQIHKVKEEIGLKDDISAELYMRNNQWSDRETAAGTWQDLLTDKKSVQAFNKALEQVVSLRKKDHANAGKIEYDLINKEINRLRMNGIPKEQAVEQIKNRYVNEYYEHYGLETKKSDGSWQDKVLQFLGLGGENRRFGGFNRDKMDVSSSDPYKNTAARFDMLIETMERRYDIYSNEDVAFIMNLRQEEGRE